MDKSMFSYKGKAFVIWLIVSAVALLTPINSAFAVCGCSPNYSGSIAYEYTAQSCPLENANDNTLYYYDSEQVTCSSGIISYYTNNSDGDFTPNFIINTYKNVMIVLRNPSGTHIIAVFPYYNGNILGINVSSMGPGVYTYPELDQFCRNINVDDNDGDSFPDCLDCDPGDTNANLTCPLADAPKNLGNCP